MSVAVASVNIENDIITIKKTYNLLIHDFTCDEIRNHAKMLNLGCLKFIEGSDNCIFNFSQCQEILNIEVPLLRAQNLSKNAQTALDGLENVIKDSVDIFSYLSFEGD